MRFFTRSMVGALLALALVGMTVASARHADGTLTALPGSPYATAGAGSGAPVASQGSLQRSADGHFLLATDAASNDVSILRIHRDGSLVAVDSAPSGGVQPVSIAVHGPLVYVANAGAGGSSYSGFVLGPFGRLHPLHGSTVALPDGSQPGDILFNATGTKVAATRVGTSLIDSFRVRFDGRLAAAPGSPIAAQGLGPFGSEFRPTNPSQLFVSNAHDGAGKGTVSAFAVDALGALSPIGASPFADLQTAPCWVEITHDGRYLFAVNTAVATISRYAIAPNGALTLLGSTPMRSATGLGPVDARLDPSGRTLSVVDGGGSSVSTFAVRGGTLTELESSPTALPAGAHPAGIVVS